MEDQEAVESVPLTPGSSKDDKKATEIETKSSLNSHYGHTIGFLSTFSLILNAGVMIYAHLGTSAVIVSSQEPLTPVPTLSPSVSMAPVPIVVDEEEGGAPAEPPEPVGNCDDNDFEIWRTGGKNDRVTMSDYCSKTYDGSGCLFDVSCNQECFQLEYSYSPTCSSCFADLPSCGFRQGCALSCAANSFSDRCAVCNIPCTDELAICLGFPEITEEMGEAITNETFSLNETETGNSTLVAESPNTMTYEVIENAPNSCADIDTDNIDEFYEVYVVLFWDSVKTAWENDAKILAVIIIIFSGVWPYAKNIILILIWYTPMTDSQRSTSLIWLKYLSKYTLVDVYAIIMIMVGTLLRISIGGVEVLTRAEPRGAILAFLVATLWEFIQIEWTIHKHEKLMTYEDEAQTEDSPSILTSLKCRDKTNKSGKVVSKKASVILFSFLLVSTLATFLAGALFNIVEFTTYAGDDTVGCTIGYNLFSLSAAMIDSFALHLNVAQGAVFILFISYIVLVVAFPIIVYILQAAIVIFDIQNINLCRLTDGLWSFSSAEVFLIGLFAVELKFDKLIGALAGNENSEFIAVSSELGLGFFILLGYAVVANLLNYVFASSFYELFRIEPYHKLNSFWSFLLR